MGFDEFGRTKMRDAMRFDGVSIARKFGELLAFGGGGVRKARDEETRLGPVFGKHGAHGVPRTNARVVERQNQRTGGRRHGQRKHFRVRQCYEACVRRRGKGGAQARDRNRRAGCVGKKLQRCLMLRRIGDARGNACLRDANTIININCTQVARTVETIVNRRKLIERLIAATVCHAAGGSCEPS